MENPFSSQSPTKSPWRSGRTGYNTTKTVLCCLAEVSGFVIIYIYHYTSNYGYLLPTIGIYVTKLDVDTTYILLKL